jgi:hypothetical protein
LRLLPEAEINRKHDAHEGKSDCERKSNPPPLQPVDELAPMGQFPNEVHRVCDQEKKD